MKRIRQALGRYGTLWALALLCGALSLATWKEQTVTGTDAGRQLIPQLEPLLGGAEANLSPLLVVISYGDAPFAQAITHAFESSSAEVAVISGNQPAVRAELQRLVDTKRPILALAATAAAADWRLLTQRGQIFPALAQVPVIQPRPYFWPTFLLKSNLLNVASQISITAILAVGMTFVIVAGGIDLSVGSLIALASVIAALLIRAWGGDVSSSLGPLVGGAIAAMALCGLLGLVSGAVMVRLDIPPFIVTLAFMMIARGAAYLLADGRAIPIVHPQAKTLGVGVGWLGISYTAMMVAVLYLVAHGVMIKTVWGRQLVAVGGNRQAARLSGIPVGAIQVSTYVISGLLAGLGGVVMASKFTSGDPRYGEMDELYVIAAVVVGGTSLSGGVGSILGTLVGVVIIGIINNGMNLMEINPHAQRILLGLVILLAVIVDRFQKPAGQHT